MVCVPLIKIGFVCQIDVNSFSFLLHLHVQVTYDLLVVVLWLQLQSVLCYRVFFWWIVSVWCRVDIALVWPWSYSHSGSSKGGMLYTGCSLKFFCRMTSDFPDVSLQVGAALLLDLVFQLLYPGQPVYSNHLSIHDERSMTIVETISGAQTPLFVRIFLLQNNLISSFSNAWDDDESLDARPMCAMAMLYYMVHGFRTSIPSKTVSVIGLFLRSTCR